VIRAGKSGWLRNSVALMAYWNFRPGAGGIDIQFGSGVRSTRQPAHSLLTKLLQHAPAEP
jgi:hypothetical protein